MMRTGLDGKACASTAPGAAAASAAVKAAMRIRTAPRLALRPMARVETRIILISFEKVLLAPECVPLKNLMLNPYT